MRAPGILAALLVLTAPLGAGQSNRDAGIEALAVRAATLAPEFAADVLLRLAGSPRVDASWRPR